MDNSINTIYPENVEAEAKGLLCRNKHLEKTLEQRDKKKWKKFTNHMDYWYFKSKDITQLQTIRGIIEELNWEKITVNVKFLEGVERKTVYAKVLSKVVTNIEATNSRPKNTNKDKIKKQIVCKANSSFCGDN